MTEKKKSRFTGLSLSLFKMTANSFYGYGIEVLTMGYTMSRIITTSYTKTLFYLNLYLDKSNEGSVWRLSLTLLFFIKFKREMIRVEPKKICDECLGNYAKPEFKFEDKNLCSLSCLEDYKNI